MKSSTGIDTNRDDPVGTVSGKSNSIFWMQLYPYLCLNNDLYGFIHIDCSWMDSQVTGEGMPPEKSKWLR